MEHCPDHMNLVQTFAEVKRDVKWIVCEIKKQNGRYTKHIEDGEQMYRPQVAKNTAFRVLLMWLVGSGTLITLAIYVLSMIVK